MEIQNDSDTERHVAKTELKEKDIATDLVIS